MTDDETPPRDDDDFEPEPDELIAEDPDEPPHLQGGSPHDNEPAPYDEPNPNVP
jgi:hypothetical protein